MLNLPLQQWSIKALHAVPRKILLLTLLPLFPWLLNAQNWKYLGLGTESITAIAVDPSNSNTLYAGSGSNFSAGTIGGIFKSTNGGLSWDTLIRGVTSSSLNIHPQNSRIVYAALGINGLTMEGVIKTMDGGKNWAKADSGIRMSWEEGPQSIAIDPKCPDTLFVGTGGFFGGRPYRSTNGGINWSKINPDTPWVWTKQLNGDSSLIDPLEQSIVSVGIDPLNSRTLYVGTDGMGEIFKFNENENRWSTTGFPGKGIVYDIVVDPLSSQNIYAGTWKYGVFSSSDGGGTWIDRNNGIPSLTNIYKIQISQDSTPRSVFCVGKQNVYRSINGSQWERIGVDSGQTQTITLAGTKLYAGGAGIYVMDVSTSVASCNSPTPQSFELSEVFPNPCNPGTNMVYSVSRQTSVLLQIFDIQGKAIKTLVRQDRMPGKYSVYWNGTNESGLQVSSGVYFCVLKIEGQTATKKITLLK